MNLSDGENMHCKRVLKDLISRRKAKNLSHLLSDPALELEKVNHARNLYERIQQQKRYSCCKYQTSPLNLIVS